MSKHLHPSSTDNPQEGDILVFQNGSWTNAPRTAMPVLSEIYSSSLNSGNQDTNDATRIYIWADALAGPDFVYNAANGRFTAQRRLTAQINPSLRVLNATANDRAGFYLQVSRLSSAGLALENAAFTGAYIRDDVNYDQAFVAGSTSMTFDAGDYFTINTVRMFSQDPADDNPANPTLSRLQIKVWNLE